MASSRGGAARLIVAVVCAAAVATLGITAVGAETPAADPTASPTATSSSPIAPAAAAEKASDAYAAADAATSTDTVPIVTVENTPNGPKVVSHDVDTPAEARAVAKDAAKGRDLVAVDQDRPVMPFGSDLAEVGLDVGEISVDLEVPLPLPPEETSGGTAPSSPPAAPSPTPAPAPTPASTAPTPAGAPSGSSSAASSGSTIGGVLGAADQFAGALAAFTNDYYSAWQWALNPAKVSFLDAWKISKGSGVTVAVIDTGVSATHEDLAGRVLAGHEFLNGGAIDRDVTQMTDNCGHGTHVAGTIAAIPGNTAGIAGAAPSVKILPIRVLNCGGWSSDVAKGITWAANKGARVINLSVGGPGPDKSLAQAVKYARSKGAIVVAAAGNNHGKCTANKNKTSYPGATTGAIGVGAVDSAFQHACFSNTGNYVDVVAPGVGVVSTLPGNTYASWNGTSMASPHVAAAAALIVAKRPQCTPDRVEARLKATATRLPMGTAGTAKLYGSGLINPSLAVKGAC